MLNEWCVAVRFSGFCDLTGPGSVAEQDQALRHLAVRLGADGERSSAPGYAQAYVQACLPALYRMARSERGYIVYPVAVLAIPESVFSW